MESKTNEEKIFPRVRREGKSSPGRMKSNCACPPNESGKIFPLPDQVNKRLCRRRSGAIGIKQRMYERNERIPIGYRSSMNVHNNVNILGQKTVEKVTRGFK